MKILFSGAPEGGVATLMKKVEGVHKKSGPFDVLFCVGDFLGAGDSESDPDPDPKGVLGFATGEVAVPVPTYFIGGHGQGSSALLSALPASAGQLHYLGRSGVTNVLGLNVAFLDGTYNESHYYSSQNGASDSDANSDPSAPPTSRHYSQADVARLKTALQGMEGDVDVLLTCEWPAGVTRGIPDSLLQPGAHPSTAGSPTVAELAHLARPRYHFAGGAPVHLARPPYLNKDLGAGPRVTRFISLAPAQNTSKAKALHALALIPSRDMELEALAVVPEGVSPSPYDGMRPAAGPGGRGRGMEDQELPSGQEWRWQPQNGKRQKREPPKPMLGNPGVVRDATKTVILKNAPWAVTESEVATFFARAGEVVNVTRALNAEGKLGAWTFVQFDTKEAAEAALQLNNQELLGRQVGIDAAMVPGHQHESLPEVSSKPVEGCWFCLGSSSVDVSLVASVCEESYLALDKGPISDEHVLIIPVDHYASSMALTPLCYGEVERYLSSLRSCYASIGKELVAFERHLALRKSGGNHCHINVIAIPPSAAAGARAAFETAAKTAGFELTHVPASSEVGEESRAALRQVLGQSEYFMALLPDGSRLIRPLMRNERWPMNLGREVLAQLAGQPERADWKACSQTPAEETARTERFKATFKAYDIMS
ncbi:MAG: hypothetical protein WDW36_000361 [Sanguina aurantia]